MAQLFANNVTVTTTAAILAADTSVTLSDLSMLPEIDGGDYLLLTFFATDGDVETAWEIVRVTGVLPGETLAIERGQEGTTARDWPSGSKAQLRLTAASLTDLSDAFRFAYSTTEEVDTGERDEAGRIIWTKSFSFTMPSQITAATNLNTGVAAPQDMLQIREGTIHFTTQATGYDVSRTIVFNQILLGVLADGNFGGHVSLAVGNISTSVPALLVVKYTKES
jgi:hypothetical protein